MEGAYPQQDGVGGGYGSARDAFGQTLDADEGLKRRLLRSLGPVAVNFTTVLAFETLGGESNRGLLLYSGDRFYYYDDHIKDAIAASVASPPDQWHYVAVTVDADGQGYLYVDDGAPAHFTTTSRPVVDSKLTLCADIVPETGLKGDFFAGRLESVRIYDSVLADPVGGRFGDPGPLTPNLQAYYKFEESGLVNPTLFTESATNHSAPARLEGAYWVLSASPLYPPTVSALAPWAGGPLGPSVVPLIGANFAQSPFFGCAVDGAAQPCELLSPNVALLTASSPDGTEGERPVTATNGGAYSAPGLPYDFHVTVPDLQRGLVQHYVKGVPPLAAAMADAADRNGMPNLAASMANATYDMTAAEAAAGEDGAMSACAWMKLDMVQPEGSPMGAGLLPSTLRYLGGWSQVCLAVTADNVTLYADGAPASPFGVAGLMSEFAFNGTWGGAAGLVDDVRVYDRALSAAEVAALYTTNEYALRLAGPQPAAALPLPAGLQQPFAAAAWVYPHTVDHVAGVLGQLPDGDPAAAPVAMALAIDEGRLQLRFALPPCAPEPCSTEAVLTATNSRLHASRWHHVALHFTGEAATFAVDGIVTDVVPLPGGVAAPAFPPPSSQPLLLGGDMGGSAHGPRPGLRPFDGLVFDLAFELGAPGLPTYGDASCCSPGASGPGALYFGLNDGAGEAACAAHLDAPSDATLAVRPFPAAPVMVGDAGVLSVTAVMPSRWVNASFDDAAAPPATTADAGEDPLTGELTAVGGVDSCFVFAARDACGRKRLVGGDSISLLLNGTDFEVLDSRDLGNGNHLFCFRNPVCGVYDAVVEVNGVPLPARPLHVVPGPVDAGNSLVEVADPDGCAEVPNTLRVTLRDAAGCVVNDPTAAPAASVAGPHMLGELALAYVGAGVWEAPLTVDAGGRYEVAVSLGGPGGPLLGGAPLCHTFCPGYSLRFDGWGSAEFYEANVDFSPLDLAGGPLTMSAWVKRNGPGITPPPMPVAPPAPAAPPRVLPNVRRSLLQDNDLGQWTETGTGAGRYILFKGDWKQIGENHKGYYLKVSPDWAELEAGVYVPGPHPRGAGVFRRVVAPTDALGWAGMDCPPGLWTDGVPFGTDDRCNPETSAGWGHVAVTYDGRAMVLYVDGAEAGRSEWDDAAYPKANPYRHPLSVGYGFQGQIDQVVLLSAALAPAALEGGLGACPVGASNFERLGAGLGAALVAYIPFSEGSGNTTDLIRGDGSREEGLLDLGGLELTNVPREGDAPRVAWGANFAPSLLGLSPDMRFTAAEDLTPIKIAGQVATVELGVRDQCGFWYVGDDLPTSMSTGGPRPLTWDDFPPGPGALAHAEAAFGDWSYGGEPVGLITYEWRRSSHVCGTGPLLANFTMTTAGWYALDFSGARSEALLTHLLRVLPGNISAASTVDSLAVLGDPVAGTLAGVPFTARDEYGNALLTGGDARAVAFAAESDESFLFHRLADHGDGTYTLLFTPDRETPELLIDWTVNGEPSTSGGITLAIGRPVVGRAMLDATAGSPGSLYGASAASLGGDWYLFGGVEGDGRAFGTQMWRLERPVPGWSGHYVNLTMPAGQAAELVRATVDTTDPRIRPDCSDVRFTDAATSALIPAIMLPVPGCGSPVTVFLLRGTPASREVRMHFGNAAAPRQPPVRPSQFFDTVVPLGGRDGTGAPAPNGDGMEAGGPGINLGGGGALPGDLITGDQAGGDAMDASHGFPFNASGYWAGLAEPGHLQPANNIGEWLPLSLPSTFYAQFAFYDLGGAGRQLLELSDGNATVRIGVDTLAREGLYTDQYIFQLGDERPFTIGSGRSRGWHSVELVAYADGSVGVFVDELGVRQIPGVVIAPTSVRVLKESSDGPALWDRFRAIGATDPARPLPVLIGPSEAGGAGDALYSDGAAWQLTADSAAGYGPPGRRGASMVRHGAEGGADEALFLFGGMRGASALNDLWSYTPGAGWTFHTAGAGAPAPRYQTSMVSAGGKLYVYGGKAPGAQSAAFADLWEFDPEAGEWYDLSAHAAASSTDIALARFGHTAVVENGKMLVFGGHTGEELAPNSLLSLDLATLVWSTIVPRQATGESVPLARMAHAASLDDGVMYIVGGSEGSTEFNEYGDIWAYEVANNRWFRMIPRLSLSGFETIPTLSEVAMAVADGQALFYGGRGGSGVSPLLLTFSAGRGSISSF